MAKYLHVQYSAEFIQPLPPPSLPYDPDNRAFIDYFQSQDKSATIKLPLTYRILYRVSHEWSHQYIQKCLQRVKECHTKIL